MLTTIFYEDQRGERGDFGFHHFICQLVIDRTNMPCTVYEVMNSLIEGIPLKGAGNVLKRCKRDLPRLANRVRKVVAVYDQDRIPELLGLCGVQCRATLREALVEPCSPKDKLEILLINKNIESVIKEVRASGVGKLH